MSMETKDIVLTVIAAIGALGGAAGGGAAYYEEQQITELKSRISELEKSVISLRIQNCLIATRVNDNAGHDAVAECVPE